MIEGSLKKLFQMAQEGILPFQLRPWAFEELLNGWTDRDGRPVAWLGQTVSVSEE
jgi:hypothetical protein